MTSYECMVLAWETIEGVAWLEDVRVHGARCAGAQAQLAARLADALRREAARARCVRQVRDFRTVALHKSSRFMINVNHSHT